MMKNETKTMTVEAPAPVMPRMILWDDVPEDFRGPAMYGRDGADMANFLRACFKQWCKGNRVLYYGRHEEDFSLTEMEMLAAEMEATAILAETLSPWGSRS
jgi:hypothetical protein